MYETIKRVVVCGELLSKTSRQTPEFVQKADLRSFVRMGMRQDAVFLEANVSGFIH